MQVIRGLHNCRQQHRNGVITIGKFQLAESVLDLVPIADPSGKSRPDIQTYEFFLTGPLSPLSNYMLDQSVKKGDQYNVTIAASRDGTVWSDEKTFEFALRDGRLAPADPY